MSTFRWSLSSFFSLALVTLAVVALATGEVSLENGHLLETDCRDCHLADQVTEKNATILLAGQEKLCASCHPDAIRLSHPTGFKPSRFLPEAFPVDWKGDLTCGSCHTIHGTEPGLIRGGEKGFPFCLTCHDQEFFDRMPDRGESVAGFGHLDATADSKKTAVPLDPFSLQCLGCHEERGEVDRGAIRTGMVRHTGSDVNHPIGMAYEKSIAFGGYRSPDRIPKEIILPDGRVGCISCHTGYSGKHGALVVANDDSGLCTSCHDL
ncbi:MAG: cytochrome c3 family protein [Magnetococcales bacterium]|nr:cytochrome c3 family protein [Magnetococcales bacterium]MBF0156298.1 cytochrome c3 family protein [Magnetococcales bacterium]